MATRKSADWAKKLVLVLLLSAVPSVGYADWVDVMRNFRPRITAQEEYTDNMFYSKTNKVDDFITTISPGLAFSSTENKEVKYGLDLDYAPGFVFYAHNSNWNYVSHAGTLNTWYTFGRGLTFRIWDNLIQSKNPLEGYIAPNQPQQPGIYYPGYNQNGYTYLRNIVSPSLTYQFGREDLVELSYTDNYYHSQNPGVGTVRVDSVTPRLTYWFNINNGVVLEYTYMIGRYDFSPDFAGHRTRGRYTYRFDAQTSIFGQYVYDTLDYNSPGVDYYVNNPSAGITHAFSPTLTGRAQGGYFWRTPERGKSTSGPTVDLGITQRTMRTTFDLSLLGGYSADLSSSQSLGFYQYYRAVGSFNYQLSSRMSAGVLGSVGRYDYVDAGHKDWIWRAEGNFSYQFLRWLTASFVVYHQEDNSDSGTYGYKENHAMVRLTATYW
jgi:hypothetical protein